VSDPIVNGGRRVKLLLFRVDVLAHESTNHAKKMNRFLPFLPMNARFAECAV